MTGLRAALLVASVAVGGAGTTAHADEPWTAGEMVDHCSKWQSDGVVASAADYTSVTICRWYLTGFVEGWISRTDAGDQKGKICFPDQADIEKIVEAYTKWGSQNPDKRQIKARLSVEYAFSAAFPCSQ